MHIIGFLVSYLLVTLTQPLKISSDFGLTRERVLSWKQNPGNRTGAADGRHEVLIEDLIQHKKQASKDKEAELILTFEVCHGATNQRIAIVQGLAIAAIMNAKVLMPDLLSSYDDSIAKKVPISDLLDFEYMVIGLVDTVQILGTASAAENFFDLKELQPTVTEADNQRHTSDHYRELAQTSRQEGTKLIRMDCTFNALDSLGDAMAINLLWKIDPKIRLTAKLQNIADLIIEKVRRLSPAHSYTSLHLRVEDDWVEHCKTYMFMGNCMLNEDILSAVLLTERVPTNRPIYLASAMSRRELDSDRRYSKASQLQNLYHVVMKEDLVPNILEHYSMKTERDVLALIDYQVCLAATLFLGNSLSTFAAMIELEKFSPLQSTAFHYNSGPIPLARYMPISAENKEDGDYFQYSTNKPLKWVFTMHSGMDKTAINHMKVAVQSALSNTRLLPYCLYLPPNGPTFGPTGVKLDDAERWMLQHGVVVIRHRPKWVTNLTKAMSTFRVQPKYSRTELLSFFLRMDIPVAGFTDNYVLFTEHDVVFMRDIRWGDFGDKPPTHLTMGMGGGQDDVDGVAGVMLVNNFKMKDTYKEFTAWVFEDENMRKSLNSDVDPVSAAYTHYFEKEITMVQKAGFNWRLGWPTTKTEFMRSSIWHLHGQRFADTTGLWNGRMDLMLNGMMQACGNADPACRAFMDKWKTLATCTVSSTSCASPTRMTSLTATAGMSMTYEL